MSQILRAEAAGVSSYILGTSAFTDAASHHDEIAKCGTAIIVAPSADSKLVPTNWC